MKLYLNKKIESIPIFKSLIILLSNIESDERLKGNFKSIDDIYNVIHMTDPVRDFINYYLLSSNTEMSQGQIDYIINALYAAKGAPRVMEIFKECFDINVNYKYDFPVLEVLEFYILKVSDVELFLQKFKNMLYHLLYYTELNMYIKRLILSLQGELVQYNAGMVLGYATYKVESYSVELQDNLSII